MSRKRQLAIILLLLAVGVVDGFLAVRYIIDLNRKVDQLWGVYYALEEGVVGLNQQRMALEKALTAKDQELRVKDRELATSQAELVQCLTDNEKIAVELAECDRELAERDKELNYYRALEFIFPVTPSTDTVEMEP